MTGLKKRATLADPCRLVVIGNSGSGKSTFSKKIGDARNLQTFDLDHAFWRKDNQQRKRSEAASAVAELARTRDWIIEGVYEFLLETALPRATELIWLDLSWEECRTGLLQRGLHYGMDPSDPNALRAWADAHRERLEKQSQLYDDFLKRKNCLRTRHEVAIFLEDHLRPE